MNNPHVIYVAIVEAYRLVAEMLAACLNENQEFHVPFIAENGEDLLKKIDSSSCKPDICVLDVSMHGISGYETTRRIKEKYPQTHVLALTAIKTEQSVLQMFKFGASGYILKHATLEVFTMALKETFINGFYFHNDGVTKPKYKCKNDIKYRLKRCLSESDIEFLSLCCTDMSYEKIAKKCS